MTKTRTLANGAILLRPTHPNVGVRVSYLKRLVNMIDDMHTSIMYWFKVAYRRHRPVMAMDASPVIQIGRVLKRIGRRWLKAFKEMSQSLSRYFATQVHSSVDASLRGALKEAGVTSSFRSSEAMNEAFQAVVQENVSLINSIPQQYLSRVEGAVMRSIASGGDIEGLTAELQKLHGVTQKRAAFIAQDQINKATATAARVRQIDMGMNEAAWEHTGRAKHPRPKHVAASGKLFDLRRGAWIEGEYIWPGEKPNCMCVSRPVLNTLRMNS